MPSTSIITKSQRGFTLLELLIYMGLFSGLLTILSAFFISTLETQSDAATAANLDADSWYLMSRFQHDLYQANSIVSPSSDGETTGTLTLNFEDHQVHYLLSDDKIIIVEDDQSASLLSNSITASNLSFTRLGNGEDATSITVEVELHQAGDNLTKTLEFTTGLR